MATLAEPETTSIPAKEIKSDKDGPLSSKRNTELNFLDKDNIHVKDDDSNKKQKLEIPSISNKNPLLPVIEEIKDINGAEKNGIQEGKVEEVEEEDEDEDEEDYEGEDEDDDEDEDEEDDDDDDDDTEHSNGEAEVADRKGKGIMMDNKGKGKLIEESEDSSDCEGESDTDSDLSDDPLAEVEVDNILPSRTRRCSSPRVYISKNQGNRKAEDGHSDDSDS